MNARNDAHIHAPRSLRLLACLPLVSPSAYGLPYCCLLRISVSVSACGLPCCHMLISRVRPIFFSLPGSSAVRSFRPPVGYLFSTTMQPCFNLADIPSHPLLDLVMSVHESDQALRCGNGSVTGYGYRSCGLRKPPELLAYAHGDRAFRHIRCAFLGVPFSRRPQCAPPHYEHAKLRPAICA